MERLKRVGQGCLDGGQGIMECQKWTSGNLIRCEGGRVVVGFNCLMGRAEVEDTLVSRQSLHARVGLCRSDVR